ncbi:MAG: metal-dependent hydrolase [Candidatus Methanosuratus sp.]|nr:metal-dependent hydrolase [Candidatus Methanosuratincola sp.]
MRIRYLGHAGFEITIDGINVVVDPFISRNPSSKLRVTEVSKADIVAVTHSHFDHFGDAAEIAKRDGASFVAVYEIAETAEKDGVSRTEAVNVGGCCVVEGLKIYCTPALHTGNPCGFVFSGREGAVYHAGDTGLFGDMRQVGELYRPDVAMLPIGGRFTMNPEEAAIATGLLSPRVVIPMHYNTFDTIKQDPHRFASLVKERAGSKVIIMEEGERIEI